MKHIRTYENYRLKNKKDQIIKEAVLQVNDIYKVKTMIDIPQSLINKYVAKVKDTTGKNLRQFFGDVDIAEEIVKYINMNNLDVDKIPGGALMGGQEQAQTQGQSQVQTQDQNQAQMQGDVDVQSQGQSQLDFDTQEQSQGQAQSQDFEEPQVQVQTQGQSQTQGDFEDPQTQTQGQTQGQAQGQAQGQSEGEEDEENEGGEELPL